MDRKAPQPDLEGSKPSDPPWFEKTTTRGDKGQFISSQMALSLIFKAICDYNLSIFSI